MYKQLHDAILLQIAKLLGFTVRGFKYLKDTRGSGTAVNALAITRDGKPVSSLYLGAAFRHGSGFRIIWTSEGVEHDEFYTVQMSDEGALRFTAI